MESSRDITRLLEIMAALRTPGTGCPWDLEQNFSTIAPYTLEEAYEVADAIAQRAYQQCHPLTNIIVDPDWRRAMVPIYVHRALAELGV